MVLLFLLEMHFPVLPTERLGSNDKRVTRSTLVAHLLISKHHVPGKAPKGGWLIPEMGQVTYHISRGNSILSESQAST